jgi:DNA segregation ATPase FtsK/SpoIIIE, S-DNA-T family
MGQMAVRVALQCSEADSQLILGDNNSAARLLTRPGEAIYNDAGGAVENNSPFQISWISDQQREIALRKVYQRAIDSKIPFQPTAVFEGNAPATIDDNRQVDALLQAAKSLTKRPASVAALLGEAVAIKPATAITLRDRAGANVMVLGQQDEQALAVLSSMCVTMATQLRKDAVKFVVLDATPADSTLAGKLVDHLSATGRPVVDVPYRDAGAALAQLVDELNERRSQDVTELSRIILVINGLQRYRDLRKKEDSFSFNLDDTSDAPKTIAADKALAELVKEGPTLGIHVITWIDTVAALDRTFERNMLREFDHRVLFQMSAADSAHLIDSPAANKLGFHRAIYYSEEQGVIEKFRPFGLMPARFVQRVEEAMR